MTAVAFDERLARLDAGGRLMPDEIRELGASPDIVSLGMLADTQRRRLRGAQTTYVRVSSCPFDAPVAGAIATAAREVCLTGAPESAAAALRAVRAARAAAGDRTLSGFAWADVERWAGGSDYVKELLRELRAEGLDALAELPLDTATGLTDAVDRLQAAGFEQVRLTIAAGGSASRTDLWLQAAALQDRVGIIQALNPLPTVLRTFRPTTGYEDVRSVAIARLAAPNIPVIQVDWTRYGPKLAQVALTFGADDVWGVSASDAMPEGRRRAPIEEIRRNVEAAGFVPVERDGRFRVIA